MRSFEISHNCPNWATALTTEKDCAENRARIKRRRLGGQDAFRVGGNPWQHLSCALTTFPAWWRFEGKAETTRKTSFANS